MQREGEREKRERQRYREADGFVLTDRSCGRVAHGRGQNRVGHKPTKVLSWASGLGLRGFGFGASGLGFRGFGFGVGGGWGFRAWRCMFWGLGVWGFRGLWVFGGASGFGGVGLVLLENIGLAAGPGPIPTPLLFHLINPKPPNLKNPQS